MRLIDTMSSWGRTIGSMLDKRINSAEIAVSARLHHIVRNLLRATHVPFTTSKCDNSLQYLLQAAPLNRAATQHDVVLDDWHVEAFETLLRAAIQHINPIAVARFNLSATHNTGRVRISFANPER